MALLPFAIPVRPTKCSSSTFSRIISRLLRCVIPSLLIFIASHTSLASTESGIPGSRRNATCLPRVPPRPVPACLRPMSPPSRGANPSERTHGPHTGSWWLAEQGKRSPETRFWARCPEGDSSLRNIVLVEGQGLSLGSFIFNITHRQP